MSNNTQFQLLPKELTSARADEVARILSLAVSTAPEGAHFGTRQAVAPAPPSCSCFNCSRRSSLRHQMVSTIKAALKRFQLLPKELTSAPDGDGHGFYQPVSTAPEGAHFGTRSALSPSVTSESFQLLPKELTSAPREVKLGDGSEAVSTAPEGAHFGTRVGGHPHQGAANGFNCSRRSSLRHNWIDRSGYDILSVSTAPEGAHFGTNPVFSNTVWWGGFNCSRRSSLRHVGTE